MTKEGDVVLNKSSRSGFTIVELLIVIVIIGILAAIVVVAYTGITRNARNASVQSDLDNFEKKVGLYQAEYGLYPTAGELATAGGVKVNKNLYLAGGANNFYYCVSTDKKRYAVGATAESSRSGYVYDSVSGLRTETAVWGASTCLTGAGDPYEGSGAISGCVWTSGTCAWQTWFP